MKTQQLLGLAVVAIVPFLAACGNDKATPAEKPKATVTQNDKATKPEATQKDKASKPEAKDKVKKEAPAKAPEQKAEKPQPPTQGKPKFIVANKDLSNLQLNDPTIPVYDLLSVQERRAQGLNTRMPDLKPYRQGKIAYLTFDDGPDNKNTPAVLDVLKRENVKATFYLVGTYCYINPKVLLRIFNEGHAIGNHSYTHDYGKLYPNVNGFLNDMFTTERVMREIIGYRPLIIRAPGGKYGHFTSEYGPALKSVGLVAHDWNSCVDDAVVGHPTAADFIKKVSDQTASGRNPAIVLMHSSYGKEETVKAVTPIIKLLRERGYSFGVITPMTPQAW